MRKTKAPINAGARDFIDVEVHDAGRGTHIFPLAFE
jgi:hypothetical protein